MNIPVKKQISSNQIANNDYSSFPTIYDEEYTEPVSDDIKTRLREDELEFLGYLPDNSTDYINEKDLDDAFKKNLGM